MRLAARFAIHDVPPSLSPRFASFGPTARGAGRAVGPFRPMFVAILVTLDGTRRQVCLASLAHCCVPPVDTLVTPDW